MIDAYIIYDDPSVKQVIKNSDLPSGIFLHFIDNQTIDGRKQAYKIKGSFAARETPFIGLFENNQIIKGFYSEASNNVIKDFIEYGKTRT